jgi:hypothetical protein
MIFSVRVPSGSETMFLLSFLWSLESSQPDILSFRITTLGPLSLIGKRYDVSGG